MKQHRQDGRHPHTSVRGGAPFTVRPVGSCCPCAHPSVAVLFSQAARADVLTLASSAAFCTTSGRPPLNYAPHRAATGSFCAGPSIVQWVRVCFVHPLVFRTVRIRCSAGFSRQAASRYSLFRLVPHFTCKFQAWTTQMQRNSIVIWLRC